ncbi:MAG TPA: rod shape-determining protein MreD [bacterium]|nr:rod shape-determining protein MreD [bacterium]
MTRFVVYGVAAAAGTVLQTAWLGYLPLGGGIADPLLPIVMTVGLLHGSEEGALVGAGIGLLHDVMSGSPLGLGMLAAVSVGFVAGLGERSLSAESLWLPAVGGVVLTVISGALSAGAAHLVGLLQAPLPDVARAVLGSACYNGVIAVPIFRGLRRLDAALVRLYERSHPV